MNKSEAEILAICNYIKNSYSVEPKTGLFFDLSRDFHVVHLLSTPDDMISLVGHSQAYDIPYAIMEHFEEDPTFYTDGVVFYKDENLRTRQTIHYRTGIPHKISIDDIKQDLQRLKSELLKSQAS